MPTIHSTIRRAGRSGGLHEGLRRPKESLDDQIGGMCDAAPANLAVILDRSSGLDAAIPDAAIFTTYLYMSRVMQMTRVRRSSPQTVLVLMALSSRPAQWRHGYDLAAEVGLKPGVLYPILMRLADRGLLESQWEPSVAGRPPRHLYRLTTQGAEAAANLT